MAALHIRLGTTAPQGSVKGCSSILISVYFLLGPLLAGLYVSDFILRVRVLRGSVDPAVTLPMLDHKRNFAGIYP